MYYRTGDSECYYRCLGVQGNEVTYEWVTKDNSGWSSVSLEMWNEMIIRMAHSDEAMFNDALWRRYGLGNGSGVDECWRDSEANEYRRIVSNTSSSVYYEYVKPGTTGNTTCTPGEWKEWRAKAYAFPISLREYLERFAGWIEGSKKKLAENERAKVVEEINKLADDLKTATANGALMTMKTEPIWDGAGRNVRTIVTLTYKAPAK